jgi:hypothetical protein
MSVRIGVRILPFVWLSTPVTRRPRRLTATERPYQTVM